MMIKYFIQISLLLLIFAIINVKQNTQEHSLINSIEGPLLIDKISGEA